MSENVIILAVEVMGPPTREAAERLLHTLVPHGHLPGTEMELAWWVAEDERYDRSDNDSAIFVPNNLTQLEARLILEAASRTKRLVESAQTRTLEATA